MASIRQTNFLGGELDPKLWGRTDLETFGRGLRRMRNFFPSHQGAAVSRPGTTYVYTLRELVHDQVRLIPFVFSDEESLVLLFGHNYVWFFKDGGVVLDPLNPGQPYEVATTYADTDLARLQFVQSGDVLTLTHPSYAPATLTRIADDEWEFATISTAAQVGFTRAYLGDPLPTPDASHPAREWQWMVSIVYRDFDGSLRESAPFKITQTATDETGAGATNAPLTIACYLDKPVHVLLPAANSLTSPSRGWSLPLFSRQASVRIYRGFGETFGFVGEVDWAPLQSVYEFIDVGEAPDFANSPRFGRSSLEVWSSDNPPTLVRTEDPAAVAYYQERLVFGGTDERPGHIFLSEVGDYYSFDRRLFQLADDGLDFELAARRRESIRSLLPLNKLLVFTSGAVWTISGQEGSPLTFDSVDARVVEEVGSSYLRPLSVSGAAIYARLKGRGARALVPANTFAGFKGVDVSLSSEHLFRAKKLVDWTYAEDPYQLVWAVTDDGGLLSFTFSLEQDSVAWARHDTGGLVKTVCSVPEGDEDAVYLVVQRAGGWYVERMASRATVDGRTSLDSSVRYSGAPTDTITGLDHLEGSEVYAVAETPSPDEDKRFAVYGPIVVAGGSITLPETPDGVDGVLTLDVGLLFTCQLELLDVATAQVRNKQKTVTAVGFEVDQSYGLWSGQDFDHLKEYRSRTAAMGYGGISAATELITMNVAGTWSRHGRAALETRSPLPLTVLGVTREVDFGD